MLVKQQHQTILEVQSNDTLQKTPDLKSNISWWKKKHYYKVKKKKKSKMEYKKSWHICHVKFYKDIKSKVLYFKKKHHTNWAKMHKANLLS